MGQLAERLLKKDLTLWVSNSVARNRLGWLDLPNTASEELRNIFEMSNSVGQHNIIYVGMGGSSLGAMTLAQAKKDHGPQNGRNLIFVDSTHPNLIASLPTTDTAVVLASKSGNTTEVDTIFDFLWNRIEKPDRFFIVTDPDSPLQRKGEERGVKRIVNTPTNVGGRYSVLTGFGTVALALLATSIDDLTALFEGAKVADLEFAESLAKDLFIGIKEGKDKLSIEAPDRLDKVPMWLEQLIAESLGKEGHGLVPVPNDEHSGASDRYRVNVSPNSIGELGTKIFEWETTTAILGSLLGIDPFNEPDVAAAKEATKSILETRDYVTEAPLDLSLIDEELSKVVNDGDYITVGAFIDPNRYEEGLSLKSSLASSFAPHAITYGLGPRFLHSTGQLHKGGPDIVVMAQLIEEYKLEVVPIPDRNYTFGDLFRAQADGDLRTLHSRDRRALRFTI